MDLKTCSQFLTCPKCGTIHGKLFGFDVVVDDKQEVEPNEIVFKVNGKIAGKIVLDKG